MLSIKSLKQSNNPAFGAIPAKSAETKSNISKPAVSNTLVSSEAAAGVTAMCAPLVNQEKTQPENMNLEERLATDKDSGLSEGEIRFLLYKARDKFNKKFIEKMYYDKDFPNELISDTLTYSNIRSFEFAKLLANDKDFPQYKYIKTLDSASNCPKVACAIYRNKNISKSEKKRLIEQNKYISQLTSDFILQAINNDAYLKAAQTHQNMLKHPEVWGGPLATYEQSREQADKFYLNNEWNFIIAAELFDSETLLHLTKKGKYKTEKYFETLQFFSLEQLNLVKSLAACKNIDGTPLTPQQKLELIDLVKLYETCMLDTASLKKTAETGKFDNDNLNKQLLTNIYKNFGSSYEKLANAQAKKFDQWELKHMPLLAKSVNSARFIEDKAVWEDILKASLTGDFKEYIHNPDNIYGENNSKNKKLFETKNWNYEKWITPPKELEVKFFTQDYNTQKCKSISNDLCEDIETLRQTSLKTFIDRRFPDCIIDDKFTVPQNISSNRAKLQTFISNIIMQLEPVWDRAHENAKNPKLSEKAQNTLTVLEHLQQRDQDISDLEQEAMLSENQSQSVPMDVTIRMIDRIPQKDLSQGNYSTCCIKLGGSNASAMPHYLMNTAYNMIEIIDNNTGKPIGNALCYFSEFENRDVFIIDNIEINNSRKPTKKAGIALRDAILQYAKNIVKNVTAEDLPVFLGTSFNDVPTDDLLKTKHTTRFTGNLYSHLKDCNVYN